MSMIYHYRLIQFDAKPWINRSRLTEWEWRQTPCSDVERVHLQRISNLLRDVMPSSRPDKWIWKPANDGLFSVTSSRKLVYRFTVPYYPFEWVKWVPKKSIFSGGAGYKIGCQH
ncbi:hypothetical protein HanRHA438_Chr04g0171541 [Helianthus annuus]|nr:hypothetical protein HanRHA438_Chr04g0171541 [Helianthus annuus]